MNSLPGPPPPPPPRGELGGRLEAVDPNPGLPEPPAEFEPALGPVLEGERSEKRFVEPLLAPRLGAAGWLIPGEELSDEDTVLAVFDEVIVSVEALGVLELLEDAG